MLSHSQESWLSAIRAETAAVPEADPTPAGYPDLANEEGDEPIEEVDPDASYWHKRNKQYKRKASAFASMSLFAEIVVLGEASRHLQRLRHRLFQRAATAWRRRAYAKSIGAPAPAQCSKLLDILEGGDVREFFGGVFASLCNHSSLLKGVHSTESAQALMFCALSRASGAMHQLLFMRRQGFPLQLFRLLSEPSIELATSFLDTAPCLRDELTTEMLKRFPTPQELTGSTAYAILAAIAARREYDICAIECRHASCRRVVASTAQTWSRSLEHVSAHWTVRQHRLQWEALHGKIKATSEAGNIEDPDARPQKKKRARSPWVAFMHEQLQGHSWGRLNRERAQQIKERYRQLSAEERERYVQGAAAASTAAARGAQAFAGPTREQRVAVQRQRRLAANEQSRDPDAYMDGLQLDLSGVSSLAYGLQLQLDTLRQDKKSHVKAMKHEAAEAEQALLAHTRDSPPPLPHELDTGFHGSCSVIPEHLPTSEFCPPLADMAEDWCPKLPLRDTLCLMPHT